MKRYFIYRMRRRIGVKVLVVTGLTGARNRYAPGARWYWTGSFEEALASDPGAIRADPLHSWDAVFIEGRYLEISEASLRTICQGVATYAPDTDLLHIPWVRDGVVPFGFLPTDAGTSIPTPSAAIVPGSKTNHKIGVPKNKLP